ncbi:MAG: hypothetical protein LBU51_07920 [Bacteroidales bacterium]|nr:hypothetical protein [Bacteroidales bacterium]
MNQLTAKRISDLILTNKKDKNEIIKEISIIVDKKYIYKIIEFKSPLILNSYTSVKIDTEEISEYYLGNSPFDFMSKIKRDNYFFEIRTIDYKVIRYIPKKIIRKNLKNTYTPIIVSREIMNNTIISKKVLYAMLYITNENIHKTAFITQNGLIQGDWDFSNIILVFPVNFDLTDKPKIIQLFEKLEIIAQTKGFEVAEVNV